MLPAAFMPPQVSAANLELATGLVRQIEAACDEGASSCEALDQLRVLTQKPDLKIESFHEISGAMSCEDAALLAFYPMATPIPALDKDGFLWICQQVQDRLISSDFEYWFRLFCVNARNQHAGDLVFHPPQDWIDALIAAGETPPATTANTFQPTAQQLADEGWKSDTVYL